MVNVPSVLMHLTEMVWRASSVLSQNSFLPWNDAAKNEPSHSICRHHNRTPQLSFVCLSYLFGVMTDDVQHRWRQKAFGFLCEHHGPLNHHSRGCGGSYESGLVWVLSAELWILQWLPSILWSLYETIKTAMVSVRSYCKRML